jgi:hypothetical protein
MLLIRKKPGVLLRAWACLLYLVTFGWGSAGHARDGGYLDFVLPGILALSAMNNSQPVSTSLNISKLYTRPGRYSSRREPPGTLPAGADRILPGLFSRYLSGRFRSGVHMHLRFLASILTAFCFRRAWPQYDCAYARTWPTGASSSPCRLLARLSPDKF